jgi:hypothetical protein
MHAPPTGIVGARLPVYGALALELAPGSDAALVALDQDAAGALAASIARDLARLEPAVATLQLAVSGVHYDPVEVLRPGWPLHAALAQLANRAPRAGAAGGRIVAFGAHAGRLPDVLAPAPEHAGGPLRLLPFVLDGDDHALLADVGAFFERSLLEQGMAGAQTALDAQARFGLQVEHARYLTVHDLAAMSALQYEHAGLAPLWPIIETALLAPGRECRLDAAPEPLLHYSGGDVRIALLSADAWRSRYAPDAAADGATLARRFEQFQARQRQFAAVLGAHGLPVLFVHCGADPAEEL